MLITGHPGCGKSTLVNQVIAFLSDQNVSVGGISTPDFRFASGQRAGFLIRDVATGAEGTMAARELKSPVHVGRYGVDREVVRSIGVTAIQRAIATADLIVIDEIGKMELLVREFQQIVIAALESSKPVVGTIGLKLRLPFALDIKQRQDVHLLMLRPKKRTNTYHQVLTLLGFGSMIDDEG